LASKSRSIWPESARQRASPSEATTCSPSVLIEMLVSGRSAESCARSDAQMRRIWRIGTPDSSSPLVVRSSSRSWKPNDSAPIGPR